MESAAVEPAAGGPNSEPIISGTFVIYNDGHGGFVLVTNTPEHGGVRRQHIPAPLVKMFGKLTDSGGGFSLPGLGGLFSRFKG